MRKLFTLFGSSAVACFAAAFCMASVVWSEFDADVVILGEYHDNAEHHRRQQNAVNEIQPKAVVFEMLTPDEARRLQDVARTPDAMRIASEGFHWSNIADYAGILARSPVIVGAALSPDDTRAAFGQGAAAVFGAQANRYGLTMALPQAEQAQREALQFEAHCKAMPLDMMGGMVEAQRLRDAAFARAVIEAIDVHGAPVVLITGNGHARMDWGVPTYLSRVRSDLSVASIGQGEDGQSPAGQYSEAVDDAAAPVRDNPCDAFQSGN